MVAHVVADRAVRILERARAREHVVIDPATLGWIRVHWVETRVDCQAVDDAAGPSFAVDRDLAVPGLTSIQRD